MELGLHLFDYFLLPNSTYNYRCAKTLNYWKIGDYLKILTRARVGVLFFLTHGYTIRCDK